MMNNFMPAPVLELARGEVSKNFLSVSVQRVDNNGK
jgi:hypothetical protein